MYPNEKDEETVVVVNKNLVYNKDSHLIPDSLRLLGKLLTIKLNKINHNIIFSNEPKFQFI